MQLTFYAVRLYRFLESHRRKFLYVPLLSYWLLIFILTSIPGRSLPKDFLILSDKIKHFGAYLVLSFLLNFAFHLQSKYSVLRKYSVVYTLLVISFYGLFDEIHQIFIPGRYFEWFDFLADLIGGIAGVAISQWIIFAGLRNNGSSWYPNYWYFYYFYFFLKIVATFFMLTHLLL